MQAALPVLQESAGERKDPETSLVILVIPSCRWSGFYIRHSRLPSYFPIRSRSLLFLHQQGRSGRPRKKKKELEEKKEANERASVVVVEKARTRRTEPAGYLGGLPDRWPSAGTWLANRCGRSYRQGTQSQSSPVMWPPRAPEAPETW